MRPLKHGYTNHTVGDGAVVAKTYEGPDAELRLDGEYKLLTRLQGRLPVPPVLAADAGTLTLGFVVGVPGQKLLDAGHSAAVLETCGELLPRIHGTAPNVLASGASWPLPGQPGASLRCASDAAGERKRAAGAGLDHRLVFTVRVLVPLAVLRLQLPYAVPSRNDQIGPVGPVGPIGPTRVTARPRPATRRRP
ncbi:phosphotransferase [Streptomyces sp. NPDC002088]|uniref:phosphotransferase n=1 Tax=Streptomyces sp. NPDC002088 TaxID=3154665 RepID=UPI00331E24E0